MMPQYCAALPRSICADRLLSTGPQPQFGSIVRSLSERDVANPSGLGCLDLWVQLFSDLHKHLVRLNTLLSPELRRS